MTIPLVFGARSSQLPELRQQLPVNLQIQVVDVGITKAYLAPIEGVKPFLTLIGSFRGYTVWREKLFIVLDDKVYFLVGSSLQEVGSISNDSELVQFAQSFDRLAILSSGAVYYVIEETTFTVIAPTDPSLQFGVKSIAWLGGYFILSDGQTLFNTDILNPDVVIPSEDLQIQSDSSEILGLLVIRAEVYVILRNTVQLLANTGNTTGFPFTPIQSAMIAKGAVNSRAFVYFMDVVAFVGGAPNESPSVYMYAQGSLQRISTREIDLSLSALTQDQLNELFIEAVIFNGKANLFIHFNNQCFVYDHLGTIQAQIPLWHKRTDSLNEESVTDYSVANFLRFSDTVLCVQNNTVKSLELIPYEINGKRPFWMFVTPIIYDKANAFIIHKEELVALPGRDSGENNGYIALSSSQDGINYSTPSKQFVGKIGETLKNIAWFRRGMVRNWRIEKFVGVNAPFISLLSLECEVEELAL